MEIVAVEAEASAADAKPSQLNFLEPQSVSRWGFFCGTNQCLRVLKGMAFRGMAVGRGFVAGLGLALLLAGCSSIEDYNPFAEIGSIDTVVIEDFEGPGTAGFEFSERVARSIKATGQFLDILREKPPGKALRIRGKITRYSRGNPATRLRYGHNIGNARFYAVVQVQDYETGDFVASFALNETFDTTRDRERVNQDLDTLVERAAIRLAEKLAELAE